LNNRNNEVFEVWFDKHLKQLLDMMTYFQTNKICKQLKRIADNLENKKDK
jgi:flagellar biosynthesis regulator FlbT